ncbi:MAG: O-antigen ligase family protein [Bacillota bacterium]
MYTVIFLLSVLLYALLAKKENVLLFVLFFLPFQVLLKAFFNYLGEDSSAIAIWKELSMVILLFRVLLDKGSQANGNQINPSKVVMFFPVVIVMFCFLIANDKVSALSSAKNIAFPILCFFVAYKADIRIMKDINMIRGLMISALISFAIGYIQKFMMNREFAFFRGIASGISGTGELMFNQSATTIMGVERMYGAFTGPNELGLYTAVILILILYVILFRFKEINKPTKILTIVTLVSGVFVLLATFSRVAWVFTAVSSFLLLRKHNKKRMFRLAVFILAIGTVIVYFAVEFLPDLSKVAVESANLNEASASGRPLEFITGLNKILENPLGLGLGSVNYAFSNRLFSTEIYWWLIFLETGLIGGFSLIVLYLHIISKIKIFSKDRGNGFTSIAVILSVVTIFAGLGSVVIFEPIFMVYIWTINGLGINESL